MRSLRGRLTLGLTIVVAGVIAAAGVIAIRDVDRQEREAVDDRLLRTAELSRATALAAVQEELPGGDDRLDAVLSATRTSLRLRLGATALLDAGDDAPMPARLPGGLSTYEAGGVRYRAYSTTLRDRSLGGLARLEVTTRLTALEERQDRFRRRVAVIALLAVVVAAALVFLAASLVLQPLTRLRATTERVAADEDLDRRVPDDRGPEELRSLAASFNRMLARLGRSAADRERALAATRRFAADAGHELRTPMTSIQATLSSLARHPEIAAEQRTRMATEALEQQRRLTALLDGLQALARGDAAPAAAPVDLADLVDQALAAAAERHGGVRWEPSLPDDPVFVAGWAPGLRSLVDNLLENAARHGKPGGRVRVALDGRVLCVEDDGPGVPEAEREAIFAPFSRGGGATAAGSGLGLALVAQQAEHHGARVEVGRSAELGGARFAVSFPGGRSVGSG